MKGAPLPPIGRSNTALVLHDMQNDFIKASLSKPEMQAVVTRTRALIDLAHSLPIPVIYTKVETDPAIASLSMAPSDFIRRAVRFTPFAREDAGLIIREGGPELYMFSSDFPHPEGTHDPIERFEASLGEVSEEVKDRFYRGNFEYMMSIG